LLKFFMSPPRRLLFFFSSGRGTTFSLAFISLSCGSQSCPRTVVQHLCSLRKTAMDTNSGAFFSIGDSLSFGAFFPPGVILSSSYPCFSSLLVYFPFFHALFHCLLPELSPFLKCTGGSGGALSLFFFFCEMIRIPFPPPFFRRGPLFFVASYGTCPLH